MDALKKYDWLLFDADGTLFDFDAAESKALEFSFQDFKLPFEARSAAAYHEINRQIWQDFEAGRINADRLRTVRFERLFDALNLSAHAPAPQVFSTLYLKNLAQAADLLPDAAAIIQTLVKTHHLALITNGLKDVQRPRLALSPIADAFELVAISEELGVAKPDPRFFDCVFSQIQNPPRARVLVIGDSLSSDIQGGNTYQLDTCWFNPMHKPASPTIPATYEIHALSDLLRLADG